MVTNFVSSPRCWTGREGIVMYSTMQQENKASLSTTILRILPGPEWWIRRSVLSSSYAAPWSIRVLPSSGCAVYQWLVRQRPISVVKTVSHKSTKIGGRMLPVVNPSNVVKMIHMVRKEQWKYLAKIYNTNETVPGMPETKETFDWIALMRVRRLTRILAHTSTSLCYESTYLVWSWYHFL